MFVNIEMHHHKHKSHLDSLVLSSLFPFVVVKFLYECKYATPKYFSLTEFNHTQATLLFSTRQSPA